MASSRADPEVAARSPGRAMERGRRSAGEGARVRPTTPTATAQPISATAMGWLQAAVPVLAPAVIAVGLLYHPDIGTPSDPGFLATLAAAISADPGRWALSHLAVGVGAGLLVLAFLAIRSHLRAAGEERWSVLALPFVIMGSILFALLPAMESPPLAAAEAGVDIQAVQAALLPGFTPIVRISAVVFALGALGFAAGIARNGLLSPALTWLAVGALVVMAAARFVPLLTAQLYIGSAAGIVALWPLAYGVWKQAEARPARESRRTVALESHPTPMDR